MILNAKNKEKSFLYILCERPSRKTLRDNTIINNAVKGTPLVTQAVLVWKPKLEKVQLSPPFDKLFNLVVLCHVSVEACFHNISLHYFSDAETQTQDLIHARPACGLTSQIQDHNGETHRNSRIKWEITDSGLTEKKPTYDQTMPSEYG